MSLSLEMFAYSVFTVLANADNPEADNVPTVAFVTAPTMLLPFNIAVIAALTLFVINLPSRLFALIP